MKTLISTFGEEPDGIIQGIKQFPCDKLILLISHKLVSKKAKDGLRKLEKISKDMEIIVEKVEVSPYFFMENLEKIKRVINENDNVTINITGGRKTLSLAAAFAGSVTKAERIIYIQEENNQVIEIPKFIMYERMLSEEKFAVLRAVRECNNLRDIINFLKNKKMSTEEPVLRKHLRELEKNGLIEINKDKRPHKYRILLSGELLT